MAQAAFARSLRENAAACISALPCLSTVNPALSVAQLWLCSEEWTVPGLVANDENGWRTVKNRVFLVWQQFISHMWQEVF